ncbi:MAG: ABC transporter permease [Acidobacteria bacterium]|jgi:lipopolysaccharide transport system permease protein|nr:ABC transporter permease [Acidobacteriota bacterium]
MNLVSTQSQQDSKNKAAKNENELLNSSGNQILLPEKPVVVIEPSKSWVALNLRDLWQYRDLLYILTMRDIKVRYKQTLLGAAWAIIQPLFTMLIFTLFFGKLAGMPSDGIPYPIFAYAGLLPWTFFSNAVTNSGNSLVGNSNLITKIYFPRMIIPMASVASGLLDFVIAFGLLVVLMFYYGVGLSINLLILPVLLVLTSLLAIGVGMWMSALNVKYRDVRYALPFLVQLGMFASPIIYPLSLVPEKWRWLIALNPLAGQIEAYRSAFFGKPFDWLSLGVSAVLTFAVLIYSAYNFRRMEKSFADII